MGYDIVSEAKEQAYRFLLRKGRKTMSMYYLMWGLYALTLSVIDPLLYSRFPAFYVLVFYIAFMAIPNYYTARIFYVLIRSYLLLYVNSITAERKFKKRYITSYVMRNVITVYLLIFLGYTFKVVLLLGVIASIPLFLFIERNLYRFMFTGEFKLAEGKYYDKVAIYSMNLVPAMLVFIYLYYVYGDPLFYFTLIAIGYVFGITWLIIFSLSIMDLAEGNNSE